LSDISASAHPWNCAPTFVARYCTAKTSARDVICGLADSSCHFARTAHDDSPGAQCPRPHQGSRRAQKTWRCSAARVLSPASPDRAATRPASQVYDRLVKSSRCERRGRRRPRVRGSGVARPPPARCARLCRKPVCTSGFPRPRAAVKNAFRGLDCTQMVYTTTQPKGQRVNSSQGRRKRCSAIGVGS
jgi:hypothetical protein